MAGRCPEEAQAAAGKLVHAANSQQDVSEEASNVYHAAEIARSAGKRKLLYPLF